MATERGVSIVPLNSSNYATWKIQCRMALIKDGLWGIVDGSEDPPAHDASADKVAKYAGRRDRALAIIVLSVDPSLLYLLGDPTDPTEVWKRLEDNFQKKSWANKLTLRRRLYSLKLEDKDSVQEHIKRMTEIFDELSVVGDKLSEEDKVVHLLASLPDSFEMLVTALEANETVPSMEIVVERLLHNERKKKDQLTRQSTGIKSDSVFSTREKEPWKRKGPRCHYCRRFGHIQRYCMERAHNEKRTDVNNESRQERKKPTVRQHRVHKVEVKESTDNSDTDVGLVAGHAFAVSESTQHDKWIIDSGATCHICNEVNQFTNLNTLEKPIDVTVGDGYTVTATKQGTVTFVLQSSNNSKKRKCILYDVLHVPQLSYSLFSVPKATEKGATVTFDDVKCCIFDKKKRLIMEGFKKGRLYQLNCQLDNTQKVYSAITTESLWHRRFGHLNLKYLQLLSKKKLVIGLDSNLTGDMDFCVSCAEGKQHRSHFSSSQRRSKGPLDLVHSDVCGKIEHHSLGGGQYFLTFIDDFTRYIWVYILKHKNEVFAKFKEWKAMVEKATERQVKSIRTDNGGEYVSTEFQEYLKKEGIRHERTVPKNPEQNGVAERLNRTLVETVRSMLADSKLPKSFWAEAVSTACYLRNRSPTQAINGLTPYQVWFGEKPKVDHLKIFGCTAHVHIPHDERRKLDVKSKQCIFLGYGTEVKGYRLYDQQRRRIIYSRDVLFEESKVGIEDEESQEKSSKKCSIEIQEESSEKPVTEDTTDNVPDEVEEPSNTSEVTQLRRSQRTTRRPDYYGIWVNSTEDLQKEPVTVNEALNSTEKDRWKDAMQKEFESLEENQVWDLVELPKDRRVVGSKWVFKRKIGENGKIERYKARLKRSL